MIRARETSWRAAGGLAVLLIATACAEKPAEHTSREELIGGFPIRSPRWDAVGALIKIQERPTTVPGETEEILIPFCTATLIGPQTILTAEHCTEDLLDVDFAVGFDAFAPKRRIPVEGAVTETEVPRSFRNEWGSDVAVLRLQRAIEDIQPLPVDTVTPAEVGASFIAVGYGIQNSHVETGTRMAGKVEAQAFSGRLYEHLFGSFEGYVRAGPRLSFFPATPEAQREAYEKTQLIEGYEALLGMAKGDAQPCYGDSGGPIIRASNGELRVVAVVSWGEPIKEASCDYGVVGAIFGPKAKDVIGRELACGKTPDGGACAGDVITRCTTPDEGARRIVELDCAKLGLMCNLSEDDTASCMEDPCAEIPPDGRCEGDVLVRCTEPFETPRRKVEANCARAGLSCGSLPDGRHACVGPIMEMPYVRTCTGTIQIARVEDTDLYGSCESVDGNLFISSPQLRSLDAFRHLRSVSGALVIYQNRNLESLHGLDDFIEAKVVKLENNPMLESLSGLGLQSVSEYLGVYDHPVLRDLSLAKLRPSIPGGISIWGNARLIDLSGLERLEEVQGLQYIDVVDNRRLESLKGLENLRAVGSLVVHDSPRLARVRDLPRLEIVRNEVSFVSDPLLYDLSLPSLRETSRFVALSLVSLRTFDLPTLTRVSSEFISWTTFFLPELVLPSLQEAGNLDFYASQSLERLSFPQLRTITSTLAVQVNSDLSVLELPKLEEVGVGVKIENNPKLDECAIRRLFDSVRIGGSTTIQGNRNDGC